MKITCQNCGKNYNIKDYKIPNKNFKTKCPNCDEFIHVSVENTKSKEININNVKNIEEEKIKTSETNGDNQPHKEEVNKGSSIFRILIGVVIGSGLLFLAIVAFIIFFAPDPMTDEEYAAYRAEKLAENQKNRQAPATGSRTDRIEKGFSKWDGSHLGLTKEIKKHMNDPKSYKHVETVYWDKNDHLIVRTTFRGKNAFGGTVTEWVKAKTDLNGKVIEVIEQGQ